jgi:hypothetical protein
MYRDKLLLSSPEWVCGWQLGGTARTCVASRVGDNNDADGRFRRSGQASGASRMTGEGETMRLGTGAEWAPCGNRAGGRMSLRGRPWRGEPQA